MKDNLDNLLEQLQLEGTVESEGRFTLSPEKLREKLAAFQFERPSQWVLKVIQALVLAKVDSCDIVQSHQRTAFAVKSARQPFTPDQLEQAFFDPQIESTAALGQLITALWFLSFNLQLTWAWSGQGCAVGLVWTGSDLERIQVAPGEFSLLEVSHVGRKSDNHWWSSILSAAHLVGPNACAEMARELTLHAYTCPFSLKLDGRRIDNLLVCSSISQPRELTELSLFGNHETVCVSAVGGGKADAPRLQLPPGTLRSQKSQNDFVARKDGLEQLSDAAWIAVLLARLRAVTVGKTTRWEPYRGFNRLTWVRHGVVVAERDLLSDSAANCHVVVSADDQKVDMSGLKLIDRPLDLHSSIKSGIHEWLKLQTISFSPRHQANQRMTNFLVGVVSIGAVWVALSSGSVMFGLEAAGIALGAKVLSSANDDSKELETKFEYELQKLRQEWE